MQEIYFTIQKSAKVSCFLSKLVNYASRFDKIHLEKFVSITRQFLSKTNIEWANLWIGGTNKLHILFLLISQRGSKAVFFSK